MQTKSSSPHFGQISQRTSPPKVATIVSHPTLRFIASENTTVDQAYFDALAADKDLGQTRGIDGALKLFNIDALVLPTDEASGPAAIAGYPLVTGMYSRLVSVPFVSLMLHAI